VINHYILDDEHHVIPADLMTWARFMNDLNRRIVKQTDLRFHHVSTVFLGLDHRFFGAGLPVVFETMTFTRERKVREIFGRLMSFKSEADDIDFGFNRYCSWDDAATGHDAIVGRIERAECKAMEKTSARP